MRRRQMRERALQALFQRDFSPLDTKVTEEFEAIEEGNFAQKLLAGTLGSLENVDSRIRSASQHWSLDRMTSVDRNILRLAVFEMEFCHPQTEPAIVIDEAIELAKKYGTEDSPRFVNGLLDYLSKQRADHD